MDFLVNQTFFGNQSKYMNNDLAGRKVKTLHHKLNIK